MRNDHTRFKRVHFLAKKSDVTSASESFLAEVRADGTHRPFCAFDPATEESFSEERLKLYAVNVA